jgi:zinc protease
VIDSIPRRPTRAAARGALAFGVVAAMSWPAAGQSGPRQPQAASDAAPTVEFEKYTLPNGLRVILHVDRKLPIVHVNQWFHVGSKNEKPGRTGFAHLFEHMMFQGSKHASGEYFVYVEKAGANLLEGGVNGTTNQDRTNYFATVPSANLEHLLWLESDRLATLLEATTQEKLDNQRDVVKNERRQGLENQPYGRWYPLMTGAVFPTGHPYSWPVIGSQEDLSAASLEDVKEFFRTYYSPNNLSLVVAGDFDPAAAKALVERYFGDIPPGPALDRPSRWIPTLDSEKVIVVNDRVSLERVYIGWPSPEAFGEDDAALGLAASILTDGLSSRLNKALVYDKPLATAVSSFNISGEIAGLFIVLATARPGTSLSDVERVITEEIARLAKDGPTAAEVDRAKTKRESQFISGLERIGGFGGKADILNQYNTFIGHPGYLDADLARYRALTPDAVRGAVDRWLNRRQRAVLRFHPETSVRPAATTVDRSTMPPLGTDRPFTAPVVKSTKLDNGLDVLVVERHDLPKVAVSLATRAGAGADPPGKAGVAHLTVVTIDMGTRTRNTLEIEEALGEVGTTLTGSAGRESARLGIDVLTRHLSPALAIVADVVLNATFPENEVAREKKRLLDALLQQERNPNALASRIQPMLVFGADHPYGRPVQGLKRTVEGITREDLVAFHQARWKPGSTAIIFAGDITLDEAARLAREHFGGWSGGSAPAVAVPPPSPVPAGRIYLVDRPDAAQTVIAQWMPGPPRKTTDYDALRIVDAVWGGGGFGTRLNLNLREDKGYSYGARGGFGYTKHYGTFSASASVQADATYQSILEIVREVNDLASGARPVQKDELEREKQGAILGLPSQFATAQAALGNYRRLVYFGLPLDYYNGYVAKIGQVNEAQVKASAARHLRPGQAAYLVVGDGAAKVIVGVPRKELDPATGKEKTVWTREPFLKDGKQLTLREALVELAARGDVGAGGLVELDRDGRPKAPTP